MPLSQGFYASPAFHKTAFANLIPKKNNFTEGHTRMLYMHYTSFVFNGTLAPQMS